MDKDKRQLADSRIQSDALIRSFAKRNHLNLTEARALIGVFGEIDHVPRREPARRNPGRTSAEAAD